MKKDVAFSGLEAAIVLIAFVVVAAVFSYVMLGAGFFATQKSQEVTYAGMKQTTSNLILDGAMYGNAGSTLTQLTLWLKVPEGGDTQEIGYVTFIETVSSGAPTTISKSRVYPSEASVAPGQRQKIVLGLPASATPGQTFTVEIKPRIGAATIVSRTLADGYTGGILY